MDRSQLKQWPKAKDDSDFAVIVEEVREERARRNPASTKNLSEKTKLIIADLEAQLPVSKIARKFGVTRQYVYKVRDKHLVTPAA